MQPALRLLEDTGEGPPLLRATRAPNPWVVGGVIGALCLWLAAQRDFGPDGYYIPLKGLVLMALCLAPGLVYFHRVRRDRTSVEPLPYLPILGVIYGVYYGLPALVRDNVTFMSLAPGTAAISDALDQSIVGWIALLLGFYLFGPRLFAGSRDRPLRVGWDEDKARTLAVWLIGVGALATVVAETVPIPSYLVQVVRLLTLMLRVGLGICIVIDLKSGSSRGWRLFLWCVIVPGFMFLRLRTGQIGAFVPPFMFVMLLVWAYRFRLPWFTLAFAVAAAILLRGAAAEFRTMMWRSTAIAELSAFERSAMYVDITRRNLFERPGETIEQATELIGSRTAQLALFAHTVHRTPEAIPYWNGETYQTLASSFIPRFIWRDKPTKNLGQRFGHRYAALSPDDHETSINLPQLVELFINFGPLGVMIGMFGFGLLYRFASLKLSHADAGDGTNLIGATIFSELIIIESDFSLIFGGLLQTAVVLYVVMKFCEPDRRRAPRSTVPEGGGEDEAFASPLEPDPAGAPGR